MVSDHVFAMLAGTGLRSALRTGLRGGLRPRVRGARRPVFALLADYVFAVVVDGVAWPCWLFSGVERKKIFLLFVWFFVFFYVSMAFWRRRYFIFFFLIFVWLFKQVGEIFFFFVAVGEEVGVGKYFSYIFLCTPDIELYEEERLFFILFLVFICAAVSSLSSPLQSFLFFLYVTSLKNGRDPFGRFRVLLFLFCFGPWALMFFGLRKSDPTLTPSFSCDLSCEKFNCSKVVFSFYFSSMALVS